MEKDRSSKIIAIIALIIAVLGVSLGFASYSQNLTISSSANVKGDRSKFDVKFSTESEEASTGSVKPTLVPPEEDGFSATDANLMSTTISNLNATFTKGKGKQTATYSFYVYNNGELDAYLKKVSFAQEKPQCTPTAGDSPADAELANTACSDVSIKVIVDQDEYTQNKENITTKSISTKTSKEVKVILEYSDSSPIDGDFDVTFGDITLTYSSSDAN